MKPNYAILRIEKITTLRELGGRSRHNTRTAATGLEHCDRSRPIRLLAGSDDTVAAWHARMAEAGLDPARVRRNGVRAIEIVASASPGWWATATADDRAAWIERTQTWIAETVGGQDNLLQVTLHEDETTPHMHALAIPLVRKSKKRRGRPPKRKRAQEAPQGATWALSATDLIGGSRDRLTDLQSGYAAAVADLGIRRGRPRRDTGARHHTVHEMRRDLAAELTGAKQARREAQSAAHALTIGLDAVDSGEIVYRPPGDRPEGLTLRQPANPARAVLPPDTDPQREPLLRRIAAWRDPLIAYARRLWAVMRRERQLDARQRDLDAREEQLARDALTLDAARRHLGRPSDPGLDALTRRYRRERPRDGAQR